MKQFKADRVWLSLANGRREIFADVGDEVYRYLGIADMRMDEGLLKPSSWPARGRLWRDYWAFFCDRSEPNGTHFTDVLNAPREIIREFKK